MRACEGRRYIIDFPTFGCIFSNSWVLAGVYKGGQVYCESIEGGIGERCVGRNTEQGCGIRFSVACLGSGVIGLRMNNCHLSHRQPSPLLSSRLSSPAPSSRTAQPIFLILNFGCGELVDAPRLLGVRYDQKDKANIWMCRISMPLRFEHRHRA